MDPKAEAIVKFIEKKYKCSGICKQPFFYLTQPISMGPPKQACLVPIIDDIGGMFLGVAVVLIIVVIWFVLMLFCTCPIFCWNKDKYEEEVEVDDNKKDFDNPNKMGQQNKANTIN